MSRFWKKLLSGVLMGVTSLIILFSLPLTLFVQPFLWLRDKWPGRSQSHFYKELEGKNFLVYTNEESSRKLIEEQILPHLTGKVETICLKDGIPQTRYSSDKMARMLYRLQDFGGFPHLVKIRHDRAIDKSVYAEFQALYKQNDGQTAMLRKMEDFFELKNQKREKADLN